jgi:hypothetical protein
VKAFQVIEVLRFVGQSGAHVIRANFDNAEPMRPVERDHPIK